MSNTTRQILASAILALGALGASMAHAAAPAKTQTLEASVVGLNCALCSDAMRASLIKATGAKDIEPRLECGRIYFEVDPAISFNQAALTFALASNGFNLKNVRPNSMPLSQIRTDVQGC